MIEKFNKKNKRLKKSLLKALNVNVCLSVHKKEDYIKYMYLM